MNSLYREEILDHYQHPHHYGELENFTHEIKGYNRSCGDEIIWQLRIEQGQIIDLRFQARGCVLSIAGASMLSEKLKGRFWREWPQIKEEWEKEHRGRFNPARERCWFLASRTLDKLKLDHAQN